MPTVTTSRRPRKRTSISLLPLFAVATIALVALAIYRLRSGGGAPSPQEDPTMPASAPVQATQAPTQEPQASAEAVPAGQAVAKPVAKAVSTNDYVKKPGQMMLPGGQIITFKPPKEGETRRVFALNKIYECDSEGNWEDVTPKKLFDNPIENGIVNLALENRAFIPAFMTGHDTNEVMKALTRDVVIAEDDPPDVVAKKEAVAEMKGVILDYIAEGGTYDGFIHEMAAYVKAERRLKGRALSKIAALVKAGDVEGARAYLKECNGVLEQQEYTKLKLPRHILEAMGETGE